MNPPFGSFKEGGNEMEPPYGIIKRLKEMCIYVRYSMSISVKAFHYEENEITVIKCRDEIWFRGKDIAKALGYEKTRNAILKHVDDDDKSILEDLRRGPQIRAPLRISKGVQSLLTNLVSILSY